MNGTTLKLSAAVSSHSARSRRMGWRLQARMRNFLLAVHIIASVGWLGIIAAMLFLGVMAATTDNTPGIPRAAYFFMGVLSTAVIPPMAVSAILSGVILSIGTKWGLLRHYWVLAKFALALGVIISGIVLTGQWIEQAMGAAANPDTAPMLLVYGSMVHLLMMGAATVISVYKPWGRIRTGRPKSVRSYWKFIGSKPV